MPLPDFKPPTRSGTLWMYHMPGLTGDILLDVGDKMGLMIHGQMVNLSKQQWVEFRQACEQRLGIDSTWEDRQYMEVLDQCRREGWGTTYGPGTGGRYKRKGKKERGGDVEIKLTSAMSVEQGGLFESI